MKKLLVFFFLVNFFSGVYAADLFDLRVFPDFDKKLVKFDGVIVPSKPSVDGTRRRSKISGMLSSWLASGTVRIETSNGKNVVADVRDGEFSGTLPVKDPASFTLKVFHENELIWTERFSFANAPDYIVVSDIDDTILVTEVTSKRKLVYNSLLKKLDARKPVEGTPEFYQDLAKGKTTLGKPYFVYLSSSPSYFSRLLKAFMAKHDFPAGTVILKKSLRSGGHEQHKSDWLKKIAQLFPGKPMILIGDSGEQDPFIYSSFVENSEHGPRVQKIIIHEVTGRPEKANALEIIKERLEKKGVGFHFWDSMKSLKESLKQKLFLQD